MILAEGKTECAQTKKEGERERGREGERERERIG